MSFTKHPAHLYQDTSSGRWRIVCRDGSTEYFYRAVMAAHLGRDLLPGEQVHHRNGDQSDDRIENLELMDIRDHSRLHNPAANAARRARWQFEWSRRHPACIECDETTTPHYARGLCRRCYHRNHQRARRAQEATA